jgi:hypothetical protein
MTVRPKRTAALSKMLPTGNGPRSANTHWSPWNKPCNTDRKGTAPLGEPAYPELVAVRFEPLNAIPVSLERSIRQGGIVKKETVGTGVDKTGKGLTVEHSGDLSVTVGDMTVTPKEYCRIVCRSRG